MSTAMAEDRLLKNALAEYSSEHMEIGVYTALITAAEILELSDISDTLQSILDDEVEMAEWLESNLPNMVSRTLEIA